MNKRFIRRITQLNKSLLGLSWVGFANLGGASPQTPLFNQKEQGYNLLKWCPVKRGNRSLSPFIFNKSSLSPFISVPIYFLDEKFYTSEKLLFDDFFIKQNNNKKTLFIREKVKRINTGQTIEDIGVTSQEYKTTNIMKTLEDLNKLYQSLKIILTKIDFNSALESVERLKDEIEVSVNSKLEEGGYEPVVIYKHLAREYSSGEKFVLNLIATLLIKKPLVVFLDEAEHSLHPTVQLEFLNFLKLLKITFNLDTQFFISSHSPYIIQSAVNSEIKTISLEESGNKKISVETLNWNGAEPKVSFSKLNYKIFDIPSNEYHSELFERIREISGSKSIDGTNNYLKDHFKLKMVDNTKETLPVYVRNYIHHPDERSRSLDVEKLRNSICLLEKILV